MGEILTNLCNQVGDEPVEKTPHGVCQCKGTAVRVDEWTVSCAQISDIESHTGRIVEVPLGDVWYEVAFLTEGSGLQSTKSAQNDCRTPKQQIVEEQRSNATTSSHARAFALAKTSCARIKADGFVPMPAYATLKLNAFIEVFRGSCTVTK